MTKTERSDYNAVTVWGIFETEYTDEDTQEEITIDNAILLDAYKERCEYPELKDLAKRFYEDWLPDTLLIEGKNSGTSLIQDLRRSGLPVTDYAPARGTKQRKNDNDADLHSTVSVIVRYWRSKRSDLEISGASAAKTLPRISEIVSCALTTAALLVSK